ncbi:MAG: class I SAM-dependent methyltransferase [Xanthobacteraceae bacterium]
MGEYIDIYRRAFYYDIVFRRDVGGEVQFLIDLYASHNERPLRSMVDIACGPGYHAKAFAARGITACALDLQPEMIEFARSLGSHGEGLIHYLACDMRDFTLPDPVDLALNSFDSIDCLETQEQILNHFRAVARNLTANGFYVIEITHPRDCSMWDYGNYQYKGERDGVAVVLDWAVNNPEADPLTQVVECEVVMTVDENGERKVFRERARERFATLQEFSALAKLSGALSLVASYGDYRLDQPFDNSPGARRMIMVLQADKVL